MREYRLARLRKKWFSCANPQRHSGKHWQKTVAAPTPQAKPKRADKTKLLESKTISFEEADACPQEVPTPPQSNPTVDAQDTALNDEVQPLLLSNKSMFNGSEPNTLNKH